MPCVLSFVIVIATAVVLLVADAAQAQEKRFALLIGNQAYDASVGLLKNPHNDIAVVAAALKTQGFEILPLVRDAKRTEILGAVRGLAARLRTAGSGAVGFLYYSGHGAAEKDTNINYLIPIDARDPGSVGFWDSSLKLDDVMMLLEGARSAVKFVVFDACRNELQLPTRDTSKGLLPVAEQQGYFVAYASAPGRTASDRGAASGPYAAALANELGRQGLDHLNLFQNVKEKVIASTGGSQHPWESNGLSRRIYLTGEPTTEADKELWNKVRSTSDPTELQAYLDQYPKGLYAATAEQMMARLTADAQRRAEEREAAADRQRLEARQAEELRRAVEEAQVARAAMAEAEAKRLDAETAAATAATARAAQADAATAKDGATAGTAPAAEVMATAEREAQAKSADARATREALAAAEQRFKTAEQRLAALERERAQPQSTGEGSAKREDGRQVVAALPVPPKPTAPAGPFDGWWTVNNSSKTCAVKSGKWRMRVEGTALEVVRSGGGTRGTIAANGTFRHTLKAQADGAAVLVNGRLSGDGGSGNYARADGKCSGVMTIQRERTD